MGYSRQVFKSVSWMSGLRFFMRIIAMARIAILARLLTPAQFGIFGIATLVLSLVETLAETGINIFLLNDQIQLKKYVTSAWVVSIIRGIIISVIIFLFAPFTASFFKIPDATFIVQLIALVPLIRGFINPAIIQFQKELDFQKEFLFKFTLYFFEAFIAVILVYISKSVSSLAWAMIASAFLEVAMSFIYLKIKPVFQIEKDKIKEIIHQGKWVTLSGIFNYLFHNGDNIVVGRILGVTALGYYDTAYKISMLPITEVGNVIQQVTLPVYSKIHTDKKRLWKAFMKTIIGVSLLTIPMGILFIVFTQQIIMLLLGAKWLPAVPVLQVLTIFGVIRAISSTPVSLFYAIGNHSYVTVITLVSFLAMALTIIPFITWYGLLGAGYAAIFATFVAVPFIGYYLYITFKK